MGGKHCVTGRGSTGMVDSSESTVTVMPSASSHVEENVLERKIERVLEMYASQPSPITVLDGLRDAIEGRVVMNVWRLTKVDEEIPVSRFSVFDGDIRHKTGDLIVGLTDGKIVATVL